MFGETGDHTVPMEAAGDSVASRESATEPLWTTICRSSQPAMGSCIADKISSMWYNVAALSE